MKKVQVAIYDYCTVAQKPYFFAFDSFIISQDLAITIVDDRFATLERIRPSEKFEGCWENFGSDYMEFQISKDACEYIRENYKSMTETELLAYVLDKRLK
ncbi:hypothetical protein [Bacillus sp. Marseille-P3661]|uniref:hypothetical protein n=1 Tax=Bacillus sp. Marseille-P3661 TaxID=1936234 RepID=UPI000C834476|nr:hypothetical protein [Bacillus sp. Marseille-P3661]